MESEDEDLWPPFSGPGSHRRAGHDHRVHAHVRELRGRGRTPPRQARSLTRREIVRAAVKMADAEGADAISMRRIARELGAGTMSLYWHIASKEELLDLMIDAVQGEMETPEPSGDWREDLRAIGRNTRAGLYRHRWVMDFIMGRPPFGPNTLRNAERNLAALDGLGLDKATAMNILMAVVTYVTGAVLRELQEIKGERDLERYIAELDEGSLERLRAEYIEWLRGPGRYPRLAQMIDEGIDPDAAETRDERFEFGLDCVIEGIGARLAGTGTAGTGPDGRPRPAPVTGGTSGQGRPPERPL